MDLHGCSGVIKSNLYGELLIIFILFSLPDALYVYFINFSIISNVKKNWTNEGV